MNIPKYIKDYCDNKTWDKQIFYVICCYINLFLSFVCSITITALVGISFIGRFVKVKNTIMGFVFPFGIQLFVLAGFMFLMFDYLIVRPICKSKFKKYKNSNS